MGRTIKVVLAGGKAVGKTAILERAVYGTLLVEKPYIPTIEDIYVGHIETDKGSKEKVRFYDTAGLDVQRRTIPSHFHSLADAYILVYSIADKLSFQLLYDIKKDIERNKEKKDVPIIVIGNKTDLLNDRIINADMAEAWSSNEKMKYFETTVLNRPSLLEPLLYLSSRMSTQQTKASFPQLSISRKSKD